MWSLVILVSFMALWAEAQNSKGPPSQDHSNHGWDIRLAVPGEPGSDYPTLGTIPRTTFTCAGKEPGYYADLETGCQVFRVCTVGSTYGFQSFLCPNGTLFNQEVFVCDWWMNVKCQYSQRLINTNSEQFGNLRLGPQLMKDIKKMLTHPMRNPYDKNSMKSNLVVMQEYKPPTGQLFPNGALLAGPERPPNNIYVPAKQILQNLVQTYSVNDASFTASTPATRYIPAAFTTKPFNSDDAEVFQKQRQGARYVQQSNVQATQHTAVDSLVSNGNAAQFTQNRNNAKLTSQNQNQNYNQANAQFTQNQIANSISTQTGNTQNIQRGHLNRQRPQDTVNKKYQFNDGNQNGLVTYTKQRYNQEKRPNIYKPPISTFPEEINGNFGNKLKQNLVSADVPSTVITKTLTFSKIIQDPKPGRPKSRVTVKTWIIKPKTGRLIAEPTSHINGKPTLPPQERLVVEATSPYIYNRPTKPPQLERVVEEESLKPFTYIPPTILPKLLNAVEKPKPYVYTRPANPPKLQKADNDEEGKSYNGLLSLMPPQAEIESDIEPQSYVYNRPTLAPNQPLRSYLPPAPTESSKVQFIQVARLRSTLPSLTPTKDPRAYLAPTTFKPTAKLLLPQENPQVLSRQYLSPNSIQKPAYYQSAKLRVSTTKPTPTNSPFNENSKHPAYSDKQSRINTRRNNLTFTDILTKEKLDITVNDIVRDTGKLLQNASPPQFGQYREEIKLVDFLDDKYVPSEPDNKSGENLTSQSPKAPTPSKSARLIALPATDLEPPVQTSINNQNTNQLSSLPFFKEPSFPNTIERTVSLKITIPERVASYLFKSGNETDFDRLEILNTGSSNYLVLSNNLLNRDIDDSIPINTLHQNKNANISNSQALVFSLLADSINAAKEYSNIAIQDVFSPTSTTAPQFQNLNSEDLTRITNKVSQLTSSQFSSNNNFNAAKIAPTLQSTTTTESNQFRGSAKYTAQQNQPQQVQSQQYNNAPSLQTPRQLYSAQYQTENNLLNTNLLDNQNQIYSGQLYQLPVPEVTSKIYNRPQSANLVQASVQQQNTLTANLPQTTNLNNNVASRNNLVKQSSAEVEIVQPQSLPVKPAKLQLDPANEAESFYNPESLNSLLNSVNGISAQLQDKIVGSIPHPLEDNKLLTYEKDRSYYLYTKFDQSGQNMPPKSDTNTNNIPNVITFKFVPSVSYQLEDEKDQQKLLNALQIDEFSAPRAIMRANLVQVPNQQQATVISNVDYSIEHPKSVKKNNFNPISALYKGPSSYSAPQGSVGSLPRQTLPPKLSSRLEQLNDRAQGHSKDALVRRFVF